MTRWRLRFGYYKLDNNHHIYRKGKYGPKFRTRRKGCNIVALGADYTPRNVYGWRWLIYRRSGVCHSFDLYVWNGNQR